MLAGTSTCFRTINGQHAGISIAREVSSPLDERAALGITASDGVATDSADDAGVRELWLCCDDAVGDVVVE